MDWAITEFNLRTLAARLAMMPPLPGRALTEDMTGFAVVKRVDRLLALHRIRYKDQIVSHADRLAIKAAVDRVKAARRKRNVFAHHIGLRLNDDEVDFFDLGSSIMDGDSDGQSMSLREMQTLRREIALANEYLEAAISLVPEQAERISPPKA